MLAWRGGTSVIFMVFMIYSCRGLDFIQLQKWCQEGQNLTPYNSSGSVCFSCDEGTRLMTRTDANDEVCCFNGAENVVTPRTGCQDWPRNENGVQCQDGMLILPNEKCNGYNDCGNGYDENTCAGCDVGRFSCSGNNPRQCFDLSQVCDGSKDCMEGTDEGNCLYHGGRCKGFLCSGLRECIAFTKLCDGEKDCLDGSDEIGCILAFNPKFYCNGSSSSGLSISINGVCNGTSECSNNADETYCYNLTQWSVWTECNCGLTQSRSRICITSNSTVVDDKVKSALIEAPGKCGNHEMSQRRACPCATTTVVTTATITEPQPQLEIQWIIIIALASGILLLATLGMIFGAWYNKKAKDAMEKQVKTVTNMYTQSALSLSPPPAVTTPPHSGVFFPASPNQYRPTVRRGNEPLPVTPIERINHTYESIEATRRRQEGSTSIDPYAQTGYQSQAMETPQYPEDEIEDTIVETYRNVRLSEKSDGYQNTPPPVPTGSKKVRAPEKDGYLVPTYSQMKSREENGDTKGAAYKKITNQRSTMKKPSPIKPPRSRFQSQHINRSEDFEQYTSMRSMSVDGTLSGMLTPPHAIFEDKNEGSDEFLAIRRVKSDGDLLDGQKDQYSEIKKHPKRSGKEETKEKKETDETASNSTTSTTDEKGENRNAKFQLN